MLTEEELVGRQHCAVGVVDLGHRLHLGRDRKTIRAYLRGERAPALAPRRPRPFEPYVRERLAEGSHLWGSALYDEVSALGYPRSSRT